jgi:hypothetical protein
VSASAANAGAHIRINPAGITLYSGTSTSAPLISASSTLLCFGGCNAYIDSNGDWTGAVGNFTQGFFTAGVFAPNGETTGYVLNSQTGGGSVTQVTANQAATPTITWGSGTGTPAVTASSPLAINTTTGNITITPPGPTFSSPHTYWVPFWNYVASVGTSSTSATAINEPQFAAFNLTYTAEATTISVFVTTGQTAATCDVGIFGPVASGNTTASRLWHTGSFACATSSTLVTPSSISPVTAQPGMYYLAWCSSKASVALGTYATVSSTWAGASAPLGSAKLFGHDAAGADACSAGVLPSSFTISNITGDAQQAPAILVVN